jgi:hypothetical protein
VKARERGIFCCVAHMCEWVHEGAKMLRGCNNNLFGPRAFAVVIKGPLVCI